MTWADAVLPDSAGRTLAGVLPAIGAHLGLPDATDRVGLPRARRYVVLLVDGLGARQLDRYAEVADYLAGLARGHQPITCGAPSTTATSLTSLGTGLAPGQHGLVGYRFRNPETGQAMNALSWEGGPSEVEDFQPHDTVYQRLACLGQASACVAPARFEHTALTIAGMRGTRFAGISDESDADLRVARVREASADAAVTYVYERVLDHTGHGHGAGSWQWLDALGWVDDLARDLRSSLDDDICLIVTGDHGMVNVSPEQYLVVEDTPGLDGYDLLAGEARFRHLYTSEDPAALRDRWAAVLGDRAWVMTRNQAIALGLFGSVRADVIPRLGDVIVAMRDAWVLMSTSHPVEMGLLGVHGSLTADEMLVPLLIDGPRR